MAHVSIIMRTKDRPQLLPRALASVVSQTYPDWELIVVNDGGNPATVEKCVSMLDGSPARSKVSVINNPKSLGMEAASNCGIRASNGGLLVIHDDDDSWQPDFLSETIGYLANKPYPEVAGVVSRSLRIVESIEADGSIKTLERSEFNPWLEAVTLGRMTGDNCFPPIAFLYERRVLDKIGYYREDLPVLGDWDFNLRFLLYFDIGVLLKNLSNYHIRHATEGAYGNSITAGRYDHAIYNSRVRNEYLRRDLEEGKIGLGYCLAVVPELLGVSRQVGMTQKGLATSLQVMQGLAGLMRGGAR
ncbi:MAG: glycosyltransferase family 2 protein [Bdellovibrionales bacterium]